VGAIAACYKYGDRTELTDKSLRGTKEALETLLAYLGSSLAEAVRPTIEKILAHATTTPEGTIKEVRMDTILKEMNGEAFLNDIASFVNADIEEMQFYRNLLHARIRWSAWAKRISRGVVGLLILQGAFTLYFVIQKILDHPVTHTKLLITLSVSALVMGFCILCFVAMLYYHEKISEYRDKVL
jgi:hypothetical protein